jgi:hypothetical protein
MPAVAVSASGGGYTQHDPVRVTMVEFTGARTYLAVPIVNETVLVGIRRPMLAYNVLASELREI